MRLAVWGIFHASLKAGEIGHGYDWHGAEGGQFVTKDRESRARHGTRTQLLPGRWLHTLLPFHLVVCTLQLNVKIGLNDMPKMLIWKPAGDNDGKHISCTERGRSSQILSVTRPKIWACLRLFIGLFPSFGKVYSLDGPCSHMKKPSKHTKEESWADSAHLKIG